MTFSCSFSILLPYFYTLKYQIKDIILKAIITCQLSFYFLQKQSQHFVLIISKTITIMDNVLAIGISKMPKIPDRTSFHFFLNQAFGKKYTQ